MKKVVYTVFLLTALGVQSCEKEHFKPNQVTSYPSYSEKGRSHEAADDNTTNGDNTPIPITDPNSDRDDKSRKRN
jgi:hypothetical protein